MRLLSVISKAENDEELCKLIHYISNEYTHFILVGDFNLCDIHWDSWTAMHNNPSSLNFFNTLQNNFLLQYVDIPTREEDYRCSTYFRFSN